MEHQHLTKAAAPDIVSQHSVRPESNHAPQTLHPLLRAVGNSRLGSIIQAKLTVSHPTDQYEHEADRVADQVMRMAENASAPPLLSQYSVTTTVHRACARCEDEEEETRSGLQRKAADEPDEELEAQRKVESGKHSDSRVAAQVESLRTGGEMLPATVRNFFEPRFGRDFGQVRVHTGSLAAESAGGVNALAYTVGRNIVFAAGQYSPETNTGKRLLAHELTHVIQQSGDLRANMGAPTVSRLPARQIQRLQVMYPGAVASPPVWPAGVLSYVPRSESTVVEGAVARLRDVAQNSNRFPACHAFFARHCSSHAANALAQTFANVRLWKMTRYFGIGGALAIGAVNGNDLAYLQAGYDQGEASLAETLMHELMHNCGVPGGATHYLADVGALECTNASRNRVSARPGIAASESNLRDPSFVLMLSYRRFLTEWASGRLQLVAGGDINLASVGLGPGGFGEYGSAMAGVHGRLGLGGERYGGLTAQVEAGVDVGQFRLRPPAGGTGIRAGAILQVGMGAEFYIPLEGGRIFPFTVEAAYRLAQPLNPDAERIHSLMLNVGHIF